MRARGLEVKTRHRFSSIGQSCPESATKISKSQSKSPDLEPQRARAVPPGLRRLQHPGAAAVLRLQLRLRQERGLRQRRFAQRTRAPRLSQESGVKDGGKTETKAAKTFEKCGKKSEKEGEMAEF